MKKIVLLAGLAISLCSSFSSKAQIHINVQIGAPVVRQTWYDYDDDYYYMPEQDVYYNVRRRVYVYPEGGTWVYASALPGRYNGCTYASVPYYHVRDRAPFNRPDYYRNQYRVTHDNFYRHDNGEHRGWYKHDRDDRRDGYYNGRREYYDRGNYFNRR
jgi:hypothetical protein